MALTGLDVTLFSLGGTAMVGMLENATLEVTNATEDAAGVNERWAENTIVGSNWRIEGELNVATVAGILTEAVGDGAVSVAFETGGNDYTGNGVVETASHQVNRRSLQKQRVSIQGNGALTVTAPGA